MLLNNATLASLPAQVATPAYDRTQVTCGIVHLGLGAFHRAHQAYYTDQVLADDLTWGIIGAGVISREMQEALTPQEGLYTLAQSSIDGEALRVIGSVIEVLGGTEDAEKLLAKMAHMSTRIVSITVTEKGYFLDPATGALRVDAAPIAADLQTPEAPKTVPGLIVAALRARWQNQQTPFTVMSCDNLANNGVLVKRAVLAYASLIDKDLAAWIEKEVAFPCTMVDRITPATTDADRARISEKIGLQDHWPVVTEQFSQWVIEEHFTQGRPAWEKGGAIFSTDIESWEMMKLRCLNGAHSTLSYMGQMLGCQTVAEAMSNSTISSYIDSLWQEIIPTFKAPDGADPQAYVKLLKTRFQNPSLRHLTAQIAMDGSQKLPLRLLAPLRYWLEQNKTAPFIEGALAAWMLYVTKTVKQGGAEALKDPMAAQIAQCVNKASADSACVVSALMSLTAIFGDLKDDAALRERIVQQADKLQKLAN